MEILIFKTNIETRNRINNLKSIFTNNQDILDWHIDLEDIDNVLRIEATKNIKEDDIITLVQSKGFQCETLAD